MKKFILVLIVFSILFIVALVFMNLKNNTNLKNQDVSFCKSIKNESERDQCLLNLIFETLDPSLCKKIEYEGDREGCYTIVAALSNDSQVCNNIEDEIDRD